MTINFYFDYEKQVATSPPFVTGSNVFVIIVGASGLGVRSIHNIAQWDIDFFCVGIVKESESCNQSTVTLTSRGQRFKFRRRKPSFWHAELTILAMWTESVIRDSERSTPR